MLHIHGYECTVHGCTCAPCCAPMPHLEGAACAGAHVFDGYSCRPVQRAPPPPPPGPTAAAGLCHRRVGVCGRRGLAAGGGGGGRGGCRGRAVAISLLHLWSRAAWHFRPDDCGRTKDPISHPGSRKHNWSDSERCGMSSEAWWQQPRG
jgi:hypothetical protein